MIGTPEAPATTAREQMANELLQAVKNSNYDSHTLEEILLLIDHECLCLEFESRGSRDIFNSTLKIPLIGEFLDVLSLCLVRYINSSSHIVRELQFRALLSVLALIRLHGVTNQQTDSYTELQQRINRRFQDLVWLPGSPAISPEAFYKVQCSHLLSLVAAYSQQLVRAEPKSTAVVAIVMDVMQLGVLAGTTALGSAIGQVGSVLAELDKSFSRLAESPANQYHDLLELQRVTRIALALDCYSRVDTQCGESHRCGDGLHERALECSKSVAETALRQILRALELTNDKPFEADVHPPSKRHIRTSALFNRGPTKLTEYNYFYGLLDLASQLGNIIGPDRYPDGFIVRMRSIIRKSKEASFRWKALEVVLRHPESRCQQVQMILRCPGQNGSKSSLPMPEQLQVEIKVISELLHGDNISFSISQSTSPTESICPSDRIEEPIRTSEQSPKAQNLCVRLPQNARFSTAGLSTSCSHAYFLKKKMVLVSSLSNHGEQPREQHTLQLAAPATKYYAAAVSEQFVAVLLKARKIKSLQVFRYDSQMVGKDDFGIEANGNQWYPKSLIAIHETRDRVWIAIAGSMRQDGEHSGSIKMYSITQNVENPSMTRHPVSFNRPKPNPLALDSLKTLQFSPDGRRIACATNNNRVLVWQLSDDAGPDGPPFIIERDLKREMMGGEISSTSLFSTSLDRPYVFCTTMPSSERAINKGEWSFISPVGSAQVRVHHSLIHELTRLGKSRGFCTGAVSPEGGVVALVEEVTKAQGRLVIMPVIAEEAGGLSTLDPIKLDKDTLAVHGNESIKISPTAVRFHKTDAGICLVAVDTNGKVIKKHFAVEPASSQSCSSGTSKPTECSGTMLPAGATAIYL